MAGDLTWLIRKWREISKSNSCTYGGKGHCLDLYNTSSFSIKHTDSSLPSAPSLSIFSSFLQLQSAGRRVESLEANSFTPDSKPSRRVQKSAMVIHNIRSRANRKPPAVAAELKSVFTVIKLTTAKPEGGDEVGAGAPTVSVRGVHPTEEQAYAAAMLDLLYSLEVAEGDPLPKVRAIAKTKTLPAKDRLKSIQSSCQDSEAAERFEFLVRRSSVFPEEEGEKGDIDMEALLDVPLMPCTLWDSDDDEEDYNPSSSSDSEDDEVDEDDEMELVDERDVFEGIEGSGATGKDEEVPQA